MKAAAVVICLVLTALGGAAAPATGAPKPLLPGRPARATVLDYAQRIDVNDIAMFVTNTGSFAFDMTIGNAGLEFPRGSGKTAVFAGGLWLGAAVGGQTRVTVAEYSAEYRPGAAVDGVPDDPSRAEYKVYKLSRVYADPSVRDAALADYTGGAVPHGAPPVAVQTDGSLDILGDQMCWAVYHDLDPADHTSGAGSTAPLGVEVQQTAFAYDRGGALGNTIFVKYRIINRGSNDLEDMHVAIWLDPDLGGFTDDLVGCDPAAGLGFCYNATNTDLVYGAAPPAVGVDLVQGPYDPAIGARRPLTAFADYTNGTDPLSAGESFNSMHGLNPNGSAMIDPTTTLATPFRHSGDPVQGTGWLDGSPADKRVLLSSGPITMPPGAVQEIVIAIIAAQGADRLESVTLLRAHDGQVQAAFDGGSLSTLDVGAPGAVEFALEGASPNPNGGDLTVAFSLRSASPATLELLDPAGRRLLSRSVGGLGPGRHVIGLARETKLPAGLYLIRLSQSGRAVTRKAVVIR